MRYILLMLFLWPPSFAEDAGINMQEVMKKAVTAGKTPVTTLLKQFKLKPLTTPTADGRTRYQITFIEKGSYFEKQGLKAGDIVTGAP